jgi:membrane associated rhomboid family serine protease
MRRPFLKVLHFSVVGPDPNSGRRDGTNRFPASQGVCRTSISAQMRPLQAIEAVADRSQTLKKKKKHLHRMFRLIALVDTIARAKETAINPFEDVRVRTFVEHGPCFFSPAFASAESCPGDEERAVLWLPWPARQQPTGCRDQVHETARARHPFAALTPQAATGCWQKSTYRIRTGAARPEPLWPRKGATGDECQSRKDKTTSSRLKHANMPPRINIPPVTRILLIVLALQSVLSAAIRYRQWTAHSEIVIPYLNLIPQLSLVYPWTFVTTTLVESNIFTLSIACVTLYNGGRYLERAWSSREFAKFLLVSALIPNVLTFATLIVLFAFTRHERWTYVTLPPRTTVVEIANWLLDSLTTIAGTIPLQISFLVAFSQLVPAHTVTLFRGLLSLRVPRFPLVYVGVVTFLCLTPLLTSASFFLAIYGFLTSWTYLRFYKPVFPDLDTSQPSSLRGDASETFAFAEFFPGPVRPFVAGVSNQIFDALVAVRICTPFSAADHHTTRGDGFGQRGAPGSARAEAERRRALALKALDQRLHAATAQSAQRAPSAGPSAAPPNPPPSASGPTVQTQPQIGGQKAMTSQPSGMLGETNYTPDGDGDKP